MKKKKLDKIAEYVLDKMYGCGNSIKSSVDNIDWCVYDEEISTKFKNLVMTIVESNSCNVKIGLNCDCITIRTDDYNNIKSTTQTAYSDDDNMTISIYKDRGFTMCLGYTLNCGYNDDKMYDNLFETIRVYVRVEHFNMFNHINDSVMKVFNRENNLKNLLE